MLGTKYSKVFGVKAALGVYFPTYKKYLNACFITFTDRALTLAVGFIDLKYFSYTFRNPIPISHSDGTLWKAAVRLIQIHPSVKADA